LIRQWFLTPLIPRGLTETPLRPGDKAKLSADLGMAQGKDQEFYWNTLAVFGSLPDAGSRDASDP